MSDGDDAVLCIARLVNDLRTTAGGAGTPAECERGRAAMCQKKEGASRVFGASSTEAKVFQAVGEIRKQRFKNKTTEQGAISWREQRQAMFSRGRGRGRGDLSNWKGGSGGKGGGGSGSYRFDQDDKGGDSGGRGRGFGGRGSDGKGGNFGKGGKGGDGGKGFGKGGGGGGSSFFGKRQRPERPYDPRTAAEKNAEVDRIDAVFGHRPSRGGARLPPRWGVPPVAARIIRAGARAPCCPRDA